MDVIQYSRERCPSDSQADDYYPIELQPIKALFGKASLTSNSSSHCVLNGDEKREDNVKFNSKARVQSERQHVQRGTGYKARSRSISSGDAGPESGIGSDSDSILEATLANNTLACHVTDQQQQQQQQQQHRFAPDVSHPDVPVTALNRRQHCKMTEVASYMTTTWNSGQLNYDDDDAQRYFHSEAMSRRQNVVPLRRNQTLFGVDAQGKKVVTTPTKVIKSNSSTDAMRSKAKVRQLPRVPANASQHSKDAHATVGFDADDRRTALKPATGHRRDVSGSASKRALMKSESPTTNNGVSDSGLEMDDTEETPHASRRLEYGSVSEMSSMRPPPASNRSLSVDEARRQANAELQQSNYYELNATRTPSRWAGGERPFDNALNTTYQQQHLQSVGSVRVNGGSTKQFGEVDRFLDNSNVQNGRSIWTARSTSVDAANAGRGVDFIAAEEVSQIRRACQRLVRDGSITPSSLSSSSKITRPSTALGFTTSGDDGRGVNNNLQRSHEGNRVVSSTKNCNYERSVSSTPVKNDRSSEENQTDLFRCESTTLTNEIPEKSFGSSRRLSENNNGSSTDRHQPKGATTPIHYEKLYQHSANNDQQQDTHVARQIQLQLYEQRLRQLQQSYAVSPQMANTPSSQRAAVSRQKSSGARKQSSVNQKTISNDVHVDVDTAGNGSVGGDDNFDEETWKQQLRKYQVLTYGGQPSNSSISDGLEDTRSSAMAKPPSGKPTARPKRSSSVPVPEYHHHSTNSIDPGIDRGQKRSGGTDTTCYRQHSAGDGLDIDRELATYQASSTSPRFSNTVRPASATAASPVRQDLFDSSPSREDSLTKSAQSLANERASTSDKHPKPRERGSYIRRLFSSKPSKKSTSVKDDNMVPSTSTTSLSYSSDSTAQTYTILQTPVLNSQADPRRQFMAEQATYPSHKRTSSADGDVFQPTNGTTVFAERSLPRQFSMSPKAEPVSSPSIGVQGKPSRSGRGLDANQTTLLNWPEVTNDMASITVTPLPTERSPATRSLGRSETSVEKRKNGKKSTKTTSFISSIAADATIESSSSTAATSVEIPISSETTATHPAAKPPAGSRSPIRMSLNRILRIKSRPALSKLKMTNQSGRNTNTKQGSPSNEIELSSSSFRPPNGSLSTPSDCSPSPITGSPHGFSSRFQLDSSMSGTSTMASVTTSEEDSSWAANRSASSPAIGRTIMGGSTTPSTPGGSMPSTPTKSGVNALHSLLITPSATPTRGAPVRSPFYDGEALTKVLPMMNATEEMIASKLYSGLAGCAEAIDDVRTLIDLMNEIREEENSHKETAANANATVSGCRSQNEAGSSSSAQKWNEAVSEGVNYDEVKTKLGSAGRHFIAGCKTLVTTARDPSNTSMTTNEKFNLSVTDTVRAFVVLLVRSRHAVSTFGHRQGVPLLDSLETVAGEYLVTLRAAEQVVRSGSSDKGLIKEMMLQTNKLADSLCKLMNDIKRIKREIAYF